MTNRHIVAALIVLVVGLVAPRAARAQVLPSPPWGEPIQDPSRFVVLASFNNGAVYDNETGLVWEQAPSTARYGWLTAQSVCTNKSLGNRKGWRLPTIQELATLIDPTVPSPPGPSLPADHPFSGVQSLFGDVYWSTTTNSNGAWFLWLYYGNVDVTARSYAGLVWCVRGGRGADVQ